MQDHSEFPTKPNYQALYNSVVKENKILTEQVELQTKRLETLQQGVKDVLEEIQYKIEVADTMVTLTGEPAYKHASSEMSLIIEILTEKTGIIA